MARSTTTTSTASRLNRTSTPSRRRHRIIWSGLDDWLEPGRMVLVETSDDGVPLIVHASQDRGATWQRIEIEDRPWDGTTVQVAAAIADALPSLD